MTYLEKLIEILCTVPECEKDLKELKLGSHILWKDKRLSWNDDIITIIQWDKFATRFTWIKEKRTNVSVLSNPLSRRHLLIYLNKKCCNTYLEGEIEWVDGEWVKDEFFLSDSWEIIFYDTTAESINRTGIFLDNTKSLNDQTDEVIRELAEFLESNK